MFKIVIKLILLISLSSFLQAKDGLSQKHLVSLSPTQDAQNVRPKSLVKVTFDREIVQRSVKNRTITLKPINPKGRKVRAKVTIEDKSTLVFTPNELLKEGAYRVTVKPLKLKANKDDYQLSSFMKKVLYWLCSWFYDDISKCPLYKKFYKVPSFIKTKIIKYTFSVVDEPEILRIKLNTTSLELNEGDSTQLNAVASYDDNSTKDITQEVVWSISKPQIASIDTNAILNATQEGTAQITATLENITSQILLLSVRKVINGHTLPPEPDATLNNSTLLGIDSNNNGVRDDVERWIYKTYTIPVEIGLFMQSARAYQKVIEDPSKAHETTVHIDNSFSCSSYIVDNNINLYEKYKYVDMDKELEKIQFNSIKRHMAYERFNAEFSGEVFSAPKASKDKCEFDENGILGDSL